MKSSPAIIMSIHHDQRASGVTSTVTLAIIIVRTQVETKNGFKEKRKRFGTDIPFQKVVSMSNLQNKSSEKSKTKSNALKRIRIPICFREKTKLVCISFS